MIKIKWIGLYAIPLIIFSTVVTMANLEWRALLQTEKEQIARSTSAQAVVIQRELHADLLNHINILTLMSQRMAQTPTMSEAMWLADARHHLEKIPYLYHLSWLSPDHSQRRDLSTEGEREPTIYRQILDNHRMGVSNPFARGNRYAIQLSLPISYPDGTIGHLVAHGYLSELIRSVATTYHQEGYKTRFITNGLEICCDSGDPELSGEWGKQVNINVSRISIAATIWPGAELLASQRSPLVRTPLVAGPIVGSLIALSFHLLISARLRNRQLRVAHTKLRNLSTAMDQSNDSVIVTDPGGTIIYANRRFSKTTGLPWEQLEGQNIRQLRPLGVEGECTFCSEFDNAIQGTKQWIGEVRRGSAGSHRWEQATITPVADEKGVISHYLGVRYDITDRKQLEERLNDMAYYDKLTGLYNRSYLDENAHQLLVRADRVERKLAVLFLDLDRFKIVNDSLGHEFGDLLLKEVAKRLLQSVREDDLVIRLGGDEFLVILTDVRRNDDTFHIAQTLIKAITTPFDILGRDLFIGTSIGISLFPEDGKSMTELMKNADVAMYRVKAEGRGHFCFFRPGMSAYSEEQLTLETELRYALERNQFELYYQPQIDCQSMKIFSAEALLRWNHPQHGVVNPDKFIPILEDSGLIIEVGEWVIAESCRQLIAWQEDGYSGISIAINISRLQLQQENFATRVAQILDACGYDQQRHKLEFEITESTLMQHMERAVELLNELNNKFGIKVAIDDFGTGYSSLGSLKMLPVDTIKIDRSFISDAGKNRDDEAIISAIIAMAHQLQLRVVAEGVETEEQLKFCTEHHCTEIQGFLFSRPLPVSHFRELLQGENNLESLCSDCNE